MTRLVVLRPEPGASQTVERARAMGLDGVSLPLFAVEPVEAELPGPEGFDGILLTSANGARALDRRLAGLPVHAVGSATAAAADALGHDVASIGTRGVEALLEALPPSLRLLHPCGEDRIDAPARQAITAVPVYRSVALPAPDLSPLEGSVVLIHSPRAGRRLAALADANGIEKGRIVVAAISPAAATAAGPGWKRVEAASEPSDAALLPLAARLCHEAAAG